MYVHDLGLCVTVQLLEDTPAVPSLGKLCEEHGYSHEWVSGQKPRLTKKGKKLPIKLRLRIDKCSWNDWNQWRWA